MDTAEKEYVNYDGSTHCTCTSVQGKICKFPKMGRVDGPGGKPNSRLPAVERQYANATTNNTVVRMTSIVVESR